MKHFFVLFLLICANTFAQITPQNKSNLQKDPYFKAVPATADAEKVKHIHSETFGVKKDEYDGNPVFKGNVVFTHKGSTLTADEVVLYSDDNFVKAFGNVKLQNADGSVITAEEMEYDGNSERGIARKNVFLTDPNKQLKLRPYITIERPMKLILIQEVQFLIVKVRCTRNRRLIT